MIGKVTNSILTKEGSLVMGTDNARDLLEQIYHNYQSFRNCKDLKKFIDSAFENSYFEL